MLRSVIHSEYKWQCNTHTNKYTDHWNAPCTVKYPAVWPNCLLREIVENLAVWWKRALIEKHHAGYMLLKKSYNYFFLLNSTIQYMFNNVNWWHKLNGSVNLRTANHVTNLVLLNYKSCLHKNCIWSRNNTFLPALSFGIVNAMLDFMICLWIFCTVMPLFHIKLLPWQEMRGNDEFYFVQSDKQLLRTIEKPVGPVLMK